MHSIQCMSDVFSTILFRSFSFSKTISAQIGLIKSVFLNLAQVMRRRFFGTVLRIKETNRN